MNLKTFLCETLLLSRIDFAKGFLHCGKTDCLHCCTGIRASDQYSWRGINAGGLTMPKRLRALLRGTEDAVPGDYILALVATVGLFLAVLMGMVT